MENNIVELVLPPIISFSFTGGLRTQYKNALPILEHFDIKATFYTPTQWLDEHHPLYMSRDQVSDIYGKGHEIGSHGIANPYLPLSFRQTKEIEKSKSVLDEVIGTKIKSFAYPYGRYTKGIIEKVQKAGYQNARAMTGLFHGYNTRQMKSQWAIWCKSVRKETTIAEVKTWIDTAKIDLAKKGDMWLVLNFNQVVDTPYRHGCTRDMLYIVCEAVKNSGARVLPISKAFEAYYEK